MNFKSSNAWSADTLSTDPAYGHWSIAGDNTPMRALVTKNHTNFESLINRHPQMRFLYWRAQ
jgi:hypothetical protein